MAHLKWEGATIFGFLSKTSGPTGSYRLQRSIIPGVSGFRGYRRGRENLQWQISGRLNGVSKAATVALVEMLIEAQDGVPGTFTDSAGNDWDDCILTNVVPSAPQRVRFADGSYGFTLTFTCTIECMAPTI